MKDGMLKINILVLVIGAFAFVILSLFAPDGVISKEGLGLIAIAWVYLLFNTIALAVDE